MCIFRDLMSIPEDLRDVLETCLAEDANPENLAIYLPKVRAIITRLLQGLRIKQSMYRRIVSEQPHASRHRSSHTRTNSRSSKSDKAASKQDDEAKQRRSQLSRSHVDEERHVERERENAHAVRQSVRRSHSSKPSEPQPRMTPPPVFQEPDDDPPVANDKTVTNPSNGQYAQVSSRNSQSAYPPSYAQQEPAVPTLPNPRGSYPSTPEIEAPSAPPQSAPVPPSVKRYSLVDKPVSPPPTSPPTVVIEEPSPDRNDTNGVDASPPQTPPIEAPDTPAVASSLAALKKSEALERRASKRFSTYHFSKMTGGAITRERSLPASSNRRSMAASSTLTAGDLAVLTEVDEPEGKRDGAAKRLPRTPSPAGVEVAPPVPPLPPLMADTARAPTLPRTQSHLSKLSEEVEPEESSTAFPVFLQVGREVKKVTLEPGLTFASLRMLFVDKFAYNPRMENFPAIYIRDPSSGVQYELEDIDEVKEKCLLSLNIERESSSHSRGTVLAQCVFLQRWIRSSNTLMHRYPPCPTISRSSRPRWVRTNGHPSISTPSSRMISRRVRPSRTDPRRNNSPTSPTDSRASLAMPTTNPTPSSSPKRPASRSSYNPKRRVRPPCPSTRAASWTISRPNSTKSRISDEISGSCGNSTPSL